MVKELGLDISLSLRGFPLQADFSPFILCLVSCSEIPLTLCSGTLEVVGTEHSVGFGPLCLEAKAEDGAVEHLLSGPPSPSRSGSCTWEQHPERPLPQVSRTSVCLEPCDLGEQGGLEGKV